MVKKGLFQKIMVLRKLDIHTWKRKMKPDPYLTLHTKINSKCIKNLNTIAETVKLLE